MINSLNYSSLMEFFLQYCTVCTTRKMPSRLPTLARRSMVHVAPPLSCLRDFWPSRWEWLVGGVFDNSFTDSECTILEASSVASDQNRFDVAYEAFRNLSEGLYDIDTRQCARVSLATMRLESSWLMDRRSYANWYTCLAIGHWLGWRSHLEGLASKLIGSLRDTAFRSWLPTATRMHTKER